MGVDDAKHGAAIARNMALEEMLDSLQPTVKKSKDYLNAPQKRDFDAQLLSTLHKEPMLDGNRLKAVNQSLIQTDKQSPTMKASRQDGFMSTRIEDPNLAWSNADMLFKKNSRVWWKSSSENWCLATIQSTNDGNHVISTNEGHISVNTKDIFPANPNVLDGVDDLIQLSYLNEPAVLENLKIRYSQGMIYTKAGPVLIAINPYREIPVYSFQYIRAYHAKQCVSPHVYMTTDNAYTAMLRDGENQSIIISGESGSGKTETAKIAMKYLAALGCGKGIEDRILETNPILEAFGNAKTLRNDNSSRFGKLIDIHFDGDGKICGAKIQTYLLEKSRVVQQAKGERSYHVFYQLCAGATDALRSHLKLKSASDFYYLRQSGCLLIKDVDDARNFQNLLNAMNIMQINRADQERIFEMLAAILWLGNISFAVVNDGSVDIQDKNAISQAASLLHCSVKDLSDALSTRKIRAKHEQIIQHLNYSQAVDSRDAMAKAIYAGLFSRLVNLINKSLDFGRPLTGRFISILDIYGFESFKKNNFEQFCINYANERLQQHFNNHVFKVQQEEYTSEGINWTTINVGNNKECLDLIEKKPMGFIALLDEECTFPGSTEDTLAIKLNQHLKKYNSFRGRARAFTVRHYVGEVTYDVCGLLEKNRDILHPDLVHLLVSCQCDLEDNSANNMADVKKSYGNDFHKQTVATKFKGQLAALMQQLESTNPHFIRCIKPNTNQFANVFEDNFVLQQLCCCGVFELVRISQFGYPTSNLHQSFASRYGFLLGSHGMEPLDVCLGILKKYNISSEKYQVGTTKIFFRVGQTALLEDIRAKAVNAIIHIQACFRGHKACTQFKQLRRWMIRLQALVRGVRTRAIYKGLQKRCRAAITIQRYLRGMLARHARERLQQRHLASIIIQKHIRATRAKSQYKLLKQQHISAIIIQKHVKSSKARSNSGILNHELKRANMIQCFAQAILRRDRHQHQQSDGKIAQISAEINNIEQDAIEPARSAAKTQPEFDIPDADKHDNQAQLTELQRHLVDAQAIINEKETEVEILSEKLRQSESRCAEVEISQYESRWEEYELKLKSMEDMWWKHTAVLRSMLSAAITNFSNDEPLMPMRDDGMLRSRQRAARPMLLYNDEEMDWDDTTTTGTKTPDQISTPRQGSNCVDQMSDLDLETDAGKSVVEHLCKEFAHRSQVLNDDADFLIEVKSGQVKACVDPDIELRRLKQRFDTWKRDFKIRLRETKSILARLAATTDPVDKSRKKWWGKRAI